MQAYLPQGEGQSQFLRSLKPAIHLHCRHLELKRPGRQRWTVTAPLPLHMAAEFKGHGWVRNFFQSNLLTAVEAMILCSGLCKNSMPKVQALQVADQ